MFNTEEAKALAHTTYKSQPHKQLKKAGHKLFNPVQNLSEIKTIMQKPLVLQIYILKFINILQISNFGRIILKQFPINKQ